MNPPRPLPELSDDELTAFVEDDAAADADRTRPSGSASCPGCSELAALRVQVGRYLANVAEGQNVTADDDLAGYLADAGIDLRREIAEHRARLGRRVIGDP
ncbi:hypothetical protein [Streptomyces nanshensis]|uniref:Uncharacterized protein n=1 Tax=Streptomyces nanshensis TaxID=518642 RepID=A0A1E7LC90_9ACTN|nr:hypothetical protein [Streptomyces nanshensis]OEV13806.1 hypothetical protein AN218_01865 [Streptomyces nanshensis]